MEKTTDFTFTFSPGTFQFDQSLLSPTSPANDSFKFDASLFPQSPSTENSFKFDASLFSPAAENSFKFDTSFFPASLPEASPLPAGVSPTEHKKALLLNGNKAPSDDSKSVTSLGITWTKLNPNLRIPGVNSKLAAALPLAASAVNKQFDSLAKAFENPKTLRVDLEKIANGYTVRVSRQMVLLDTRRLLGTEEPRSSRFYKMIDLVRGQQVVLIDPGLAHQKRGSPAAALEDWKIKSSLMLEWGNGHPDFPVTYGRFPLKQESTGDELHDFGVVQREYGGNLFDLIMAGGLNRGTPTVDHAGNIIEEGAITPDQKSMCRRAVSALHTMRQRGWVHRDLKPENYLFERINGILTDLKLTDFEMAARAEQSHRLKKNCGSPLYCAPEYIAHAFTDKARRPIPSFQFLQTAEIWTLGIILFNILEARYPDYLMPVVDFSDGVKMNETLALRDPSSKAYRTHQAHLNRLRTSTCVYERAIAACLQVDPSKRPTTGEILQMLAATVSEDGKSPTAGGRSAVGTLTPVVEEAMVLES